MWLLVVKGQYKTVEKVFLRVVLLRHLHHCRLSGEAGLEGGARGHHQAARTRQCFRRQDYLYMVIGMVGTTIAPWMQFYLQASIVEKGITGASTRRRGWTLSTGCIFTDVVAWFIIVACAATLYAHGHHDISDAADAAQALRPLAGRYAYILFAWDCSTRRCSPHRFCRFPPPTRFAKAWALSRGWEEVQRSARLLLALHAPDRGRGGRDSPAEPSAGEDHRFFRRW